MRLARSSPGPQPSPSIDRFAVDVQYYLTQTPKQLPSRYLYDELGSILFEAICRLPWYPLKRAELRLLGAHARAILGPDTQAILELGSGSGDKLCALIAAAGARHGRLDVQLVDVSASALLQAGRALGQFEGVRVTGHEGTYESGLHRFAAARPDAGRTLALFLGSNIGNFDPPGREAFLRGVRMALDVGDALLLGTDLVKPEGDLLLAYDDPLGITAAFNRNLLVRINRELGGTFDLEGFAHRAVWNRQHARVEMHLVSRRAQAVEISAAALALQLPAGESIWTESSYKFDAAEIAVLLARCGFQIAAQWIDATDRFALTCATAVP